MYLYMIFTMIFGSRRSGSYPPLLLLKCGSLDHAGCGSRKTCNQNQQWAQVVLQSTNINLKPIMKHLFLDNLKRMGRHELSTSRVLLSVAWGAQLYQCWKLRSPYDARDAQQLHLAGCLHLGGSCVGPWATPGWPGGTGRDGREEAWSPQWWLAKKSWALSEVIIFHHFFMEFQTISTELWCGDLHGQPSQVPAFGSQVDQIIMIPELECFDMEIELGVHPVIIQWS